MLRAAAPFATTWRRSTLHTGALKPWNPGANDIVNALAVKPNGKTIYVGGHFTKVHGATRLHVAAINATASTLRPWKANTNGKVDVIKATRSRDLHRRHVHDAQGPDAQPAGCRLGRLVGGADQLEAPRQL